MTLSIVQTASAGPTANSNPLNLDFANPVTPGNLLVFIPSNSGSPYASVPPGVTLDAHGDDAGRFTDIYSKLVQSGDGMVYTFTPSGTTGSGRGVAYEVASTVGTPVFDVAAVSDAASDTTRTVTLPAGTKTGSHLTFAAVGLGGTSGGSDTVNSPYTTLAPTPFDSGRLHVATHTVSGTAFPAVTFSWLTARRAVAIAATYAEQAAVAATTTNPTNVAAAVIKTNAANATGTLTQTIAQVSGTTTTPQSLGGGSWVVTRHGTDTLVYDVTIVHSGGSANRVERFTIAPAGGAGGARTVRKTKVSGTFV